MKFNHYNNLNAFREDVLDTLLEDEVCNNLPISIISDRSAKSNSDWLMCTVTDVYGAIMLIALCTLPFNVMLYAPPAAYADESSPRRPVSDCVRFLADELRRTDIKLPGVFSETELAWQFAEGYARTGNGAAACAYSRPMVLMKLEELLPYSRAPGACRTLTEGDLTYVPIWEQAFNIDCNLPTFPLEETKERIRTRIGRDLHYIWDDGMPVSQAVFGRETPSGAVVNWVYTPPLHRRRGYATAVVAELSKSLLGRGKKFCCLFADSKNKTSRGIYSKLGYYDVCEFTEIRF